MTENIDESIRYIQAAVERLARIIDALAPAFSRREGAVSVADARRRVDRAESRRRAARHHQREEGRHLVGRLPPAWVDPTAVEQIFANLIGNAVSYLDPRGRAASRWAVPTRRPRAALAGPHVYYVKDNGLGIPEAYHDRVFTAFNRLHANVAQGEGIGLALVRRMVERHGGRIWMESAPGVGTTFFVALPAGAARAPVGDRERPSTPRASTGDQPNGSRTDLDRAG